MEGSSNGSMVTTDPNHTPPYHYARSSHHFCAYWTPARLFAEVFFIILLCENCLFGLVILTANTKSTFHGFFNKLCITLITISGIGMCLHLCLFPFLFTHMTKADKSYDTNARQSSLTTIFDPNVGFPNEKTQLTENCFWSTTHGCKWSGLTFSLFAYCPLAVIVAMNIDRVIATFCWKFYKFRVHAVSAFRLTILVGFLATFCFILLIPFLDIGANFQFEPFLMVCILPRTSTNVMTMNFTLIVHCFSLLLLSILFITGCFVAAAAYLHRSSRATLGRFRSSLVCGHFGVVKSQPWLAVSRVTLAITVVGIPVYLPLTVISFLRLFHGKPQNTINSWDIATDVLVIFMPFLNPIVNMWFHKPYKRRTWQILNLLRGKRISISPDINENLDSNADSDFDEGGNFRRGYRQRGSDVIRAASRQRIRATTPELTPCNSPKSAPVSDHGELIHNRPGLPASRGRQISQTDQNFPTRTPRNSQNYNPPPAMNEIMVGNTYNNILYKMEKDGAISIDEAPVQRNRHQSSRDSQGVPILRLTSRSPKRRRENRVVPSSSGSGSSASRLGSKSTSIKNLGSSSESFHARHLEAISQGEIEAIEFYHRSSHPLPGNCPPKDLNNLSLFYGQHPVYPPEYHYHHHFHVYDSPREKKRRDQGRPHKSRRRGSIQDAQSLSVGPEEIGQALRDSAGMLNKDVSRQRRESDQLEKYSRNTETREISASDARNHPRRDSRIDKQLSEDLSPNISHSRYSKKFSMDLG